MIATVDEVSKRYMVGSEVVVAVDGVSFGVRPGEFACFYGASGSGKTTLLIGQLQLVHPRGDLGRRPAPAHRQPTAGEAAVIVGIGVLAGVAAGVLGIAVVTDNYLVLDVPALPIELACGATVLAAGLATVSAVQALTAVEEPEVN